MHTDPRIVWLVLEYKCSAEGGREDILVLLPIQLCVPRTFGKE